MLRLADFEAVTFDVYGTLIDWEPSIIGALSEWAGANRVAADGQALLMAYDRARAVVQTERPAHLYPDVLRRSFDRIAREFDAPLDADRRESFALSPRRWPPYDDVPAGLKSLQGRVKVGALSNIDTASFEASCRKMDFCFDVVVTAERVGAYKPDWPHFHTAIADFAAAGIPARKILHVAQSLRADITPANRLGLTCVWVHRPGRVLGLSGEGAAEARPDMTVSSLAELLDTIG